MRSEQRDWDERRRAEQRDRDDKLRSEQRDQDDKRRKELREHDQRMRSLEVRRALVLDLMRYRMTPSELALRLNVVPAVFIDDSKARDLCQIYLRCASDPNARDQIETLTVLLSHLAKSVGWDGVLTRDEIVMGFAVKGAPSD